MRYHPRQLPIVLLFAAVLAAACATDDADPTSPTAEAGEAGAPDDAAELPDEAADLDTTVRVLTHDSFDISTAVIDAFTAETGITIEFVPMGDAGTLVNQAVLTRQAPQGDVLFGVDNTFLTRALDAELFVPHISPRLEVVDASLILDPEHRVTPIDFGDVCLNYDVAWFDDAGIPVPDDLASLTEETYRGLLAVQNPATSSPGLAFLLATVERFGEDGWLEFWAALRDNDVVVTEGWSQAYYEEFSWAGGGDRPLVVSYASSPPAEVLFAEEELSEAPTGVIEASCFRQIEFAGVLAGTEQPEAAARVVDFMLGREFQQDLPLTMFVFPAAGDAELPEVFAEHARIPDDPFTLDPEVIGANRQAWIEAWTNTVLR